MKKFRLSVHEPEQQILRSWLIQGRKKAHLTQRQLAQHLDVVHSLIGKVEKGERRLDIIEFASYCDALDTKPADFFSYLTAELKNLKLQNPNNTHNKKRS